jgi:hypothetical protein
MTAMNAAINSTFEETKRLELGQVTLDTTTGIMRRAFDSVYNCISGGESLRPARSKGRPFTTNQRCT